MSSAKGTDPVPLVSIIVPVYNAAPFIDSTIDTVRNQTFGDWELILVDDASCDDSVERIRTVGAKLVMAGNVRFAEEGAAAGSKTDAIRKADVDVAESLPVIRLINKQENAGAAAARNTGLDAARGRYIAFLDADDIWRPDKLARELEFMKETGAAFVFTAYQFGDENAVPTGKAVHVPPELTFRKALTRTIIFTSTVLFDTAKIDRRLLYMPYIPSEDTATWWQILKSGVTAYGLDEELVIYRRPKNSLSSDKKEAVRRIYNLYRQIAGLSPVSAWFHVAGWAFHAVARRILPDHKAE